MKFWPFEYLDIMVQQWYDRAQGNYASGVGRMAVVLRETGEIVGDAGLNPMEHKGEDALDIGWIIHHPFQRQGIGFAAARGLLTYAAEELRFPLIVANMPEDHTGSWRIAEKLGMTWVETIPNPKNRNLPTRWYEFRT